LKLIEVVLLIASSCKPVYFSVYKAILNAIKIMEFKLKSSYFFLFNTTLKHHQDPQGLWVRVMCLTNFQQYFSYMVVVSFTGCGTRAVPDLPIGLIG